MFNAVWEDVNEDLEFPEHEEDNLMYSCLANGSVDEFVKGEHM